MARDCTLPSYGSFTHTDAESGVTATYSGPEALAMGWTNLLAFSSDFSDALSRFRAQQAHKTWCAHHGASQAMAPAKPSSSRRRPPRSRALAPLIALDCT